ncbi:MAG: homoserine kinase [Vicinamibacterales bacterium]
MADAFREIAIPGSTSNLGPAFDALSVAVNLFLRIRVQDVRADLDGKLDLAFTGAKPAGENRIDSAYQLACRRFGKPAMGLQAQVTSEIPMAAGLGSSAAATIAGMRLYEAARAIPLEVEDILGMATELEGHPDNASAALLGGITLSCQQEDGRIIARAWNWPAAVRLVVGTPHVTLQTKTARGVLPPAVPLRDAVANLQRALLLVRALETGQYADLREALKDRWHQAARGPLVPALNEALAIEHPAILGVCLSGAGPSVLALAAPGRSEEAVALLGDVYRRLSVPHTIRNLAAHPTANHPLPASAALRENTA